MSCLNLGTEAGWILGGDFLNSAKYSYCNLYLVTVVIFI